MSFRETLLAIAGSIVIFASSTVGQQDRTAAGRSYRIVDTGQDMCYDNIGEIATPRQGEAFYGQDAQHQGNAPSYRDNGDGTISDLITGLMWVKARGAKVAWDDAVKSASSCKVGGYSDWRMPTIKELYSLINFNGGYHPDGNSVPYLDTKFFDFAYGDESKGERGIDCQDWSATQYLSTTMMGNATVFGVNFADGRIKGYPRDRGPRLSVNMLYVRYVRGNPDYGKNNFTDNHDGTVTDKATGLMWSQDDSKAGMNWEQALAWVQQQNAGKYLGHSDWRLPNAKELQSVVDYTRCPDVTTSPAIDPVFECTAITNEGGATDYPFYWTSTTHLDGPRDRQGAAAIYVAFGRALGWMGWGVYRLFDVHGAGAQRSDPKAGNAADFPRGRGPQGDVIRGLNYVRLVRDAK